VLTTLDQVIALVRADAPWATALTAETRIGRDGLGFDSVRVVELLVACEDHFHVPFPPELATETLSIGAIVEHVETRR
jgi:acyl carrier protein